MKWWIVLAVTLAPLAQARDARACSNPNPTCAPPVWLLARGATIPANLVHFEVIKENPGPLELRAADGSILPVGIRQVGGYRVFAPESPPAAGQELTLLYHGCYWPDWPAPPQTLPFQVREPVALALQPPTLRQTGRRQDEGSDGNPASQWVTVSYEYVPPAPPADVAHLLRTTWTLDGQPYDARGHVLSSCQPSSVASSCGDIVTVPPGPHVLRVESRIVGLDQVFTSELAVDTSCDPMPPMATGCTMARTGATSWAIVALGVVALGMLRRRRR